jgi:CheY-like chemotaxis protein
MKARYKTVLLLDDNALDNFVNKKLIEISGFGEVIHVHESGLTALEFLKSAKESELPDILFLDIMMPIMDGFAFLEEFDKLPEKVQGKAKIIMLSTSESFKDLNRANKSKFVYKFLNKPLTEAVLNAVNV